MKIGNCFTTASRKTNINQFNQEETEKYNKSFPRMCASTNGQNHYQEKERNKAKNFLVSEKMERTQYSYTSRSRYNMIKRSL